MNKRVAVVCITLISLFLSKGYNVQAQSFNNLEYGLASVKCKINQVTEETYWFDPISDYYIEDNIFHDNEIVLKDCLLAVSSELKELLNQNYQCKIAKIWGTGARVSKGLRKQSVTNHYTSLLFEDIGSCLNYAYDNLIKESMMSHEEFSIGRPGPFQIQRKIPFFVEGIELHFLEDDRLLYQASIEKNLTNSAREALQLWKFNTEEGVIAHKKPKV